MSVLRFEFDWVPYPDGGGAEDSDAVAHLSIHAGPLCLTRNENAWSEKIEDSITVSLYPLAEWLAWSWWRLNYEPLPADTAKIPHNWRMAHEMAAANAGFVWPAVVFATDGEAMQIWANPSAASERVSAKYVVGSSEPVLVPAGRFQKAISDLLHDVLGRLSERGRDGTGLAELWQLVQADMSDERAARRRRLEARLGYDPDECPKGLLEHAARIENKLGEGAFAEIASAYSRWKVDADVEGIRELVERKGLSGTLQVDGSNLDLAGNEAAPWQRAVSAARRLRSHLSMDGKPISDSDLYGLLGLTEDAVAGWIPAGKARAAIGRGEADGRMTYVSRKRHPIAKRFEFARFVADGIHDSGHPGRSHWLVATDLSTSRQKFQRAFAAEFLCPVDSLVENMNGDFSETAVEDAADYFSVSDRTVRSLLINNGYIEPRHPAGGMPYNISTAQRISAV